MKITYMKKFMWVCIVFVCFSLIGCNRRNDNAPIETVLLEENVYELSDGTEVSLWETIFGQYYKLSDGTELLQVDDDAEIGIEHIHGGNAEGYNGLSEEAKERVASYMNNLETDYNIEEQLEIAYEDYKRCMEDSEDKLEFSTHMLAREMGPAVETEKILIYRVNEITPAATHYVNVVNYNIKDYIFDRETGELLELTDLFCVPEQEARKAMIQLCIEEGLAEQNALEQHFEWEYIHLDETGISVDFPAGKLGELASGTSLSYEGVRDIMHPWALP